MADLENDLRALYDEHGPLRPETVVDAARDPNHPLHDHFEWDDATARGEDG